MKDNKVLDETYSQVKEQIKQINEQQVQQGNADYLYKLIDIYKDIEMIKEGENMNYGNYNNYGNYGRDSYGENYGRRSRDSRGRYTEGYGARGYDAKYRGDDSLGRMSNEYGRYMENRERYGASEETDKSFHYMVEAYKDFGQVLMEEAETQEQKNMLRQAVQQTMQMM